VLRVVGKQPRVELGELRRRTAAAARLVEKTSTFLPVRTWTTPYCRNSSALASRVAQLLFAAGADFDVPHRQFDAVLLETGRLRGKGRTGSSLASTRSCV